MSSIPTPLELDGIYQDLGDTWLTPERDREAGIGLSWFAWLRIRPWLDVKWESAAISETGVWLTAIDLAAAVGCSVHTVRRQRWLATIANFSDRWYLEPRQIDLGRPRLGILAVDE